MVAYTSTCACTYTCTYTCTHMSAYIHISINTSTNSSISTYTQASTQKSAHIQLHLYIHLYVHTDDTNCVHPHSGQPPSRDPDSVGAFSCSRVADPLKMKKSEKIKGRILSASPGIATFAAALRLQTQLILGSPLDIVAYTDSGWAGCLRTRWSTPGTAVQVF